MVYSSILWIGYLCRWLNFNFSKGIAHYHVKEFFQYSSSTHVMLLFGFNHDKAQLQSIRANFMPLIMESDDLLVFFYRWNKHPASLSDDLNTINEKN